jgi:molecular chaperone DnaJ
MATTERDYYEVLGVPRTAADQEIKRAFRRKARELHPDVSDAPDGEQRFREVVEAYEVLSKPETRRIYDRLGHAGLQGGGFRPTHFDFGDLTDLFAAFFGDDLFGVGRPRRRRGADVAAQVEIDLVEAAHGTTRDVSFSVAVGCPTCGGDGVAPGSSVTACSACRGSGELREVHESAFGRFVRAQACPRCRATGRVVDDPCGECRGSGRVTEDHVLEVAIPPGIFDGQRIRISGEGHVGMLGGRAGDIYVQVRVRPDPRFTRDGTDILSTVDLTMTQAALGATVAVATLEGEAELEFAPGTQPGEVRVLRGLGLPVLQGYGRGDHRLLVNVVVPRHLSGEQRSLLEEFERHVRPENYRKDEGFFEKLKSVFR